MKPETFEKFMARCLHDPETGYYARNIRGIGARGDFTTAPQLSEAPAKAIANWATRALRETGCRDLIEIGPGLGTLSRDVLRNLPFPTRLRTRLHLVESSPALAARQKSLHGNKAFHHTDIQSALGKCSGNAVIFSNELVDAFPVRLFEKTSAWWSEVAIDRSQGHVSEVLLPVDQLPPSSIFSRSFPIGQRVEVHDSYRLWLASWIPQWHRGEMLTIDYGNTVDKLYHRRLKGSLRAYLLHQRLEGAEIYNSPGLQDLTADVNFTDLQTWAEPWVGPGKIENFDAFVRPCLGIHNALILSALEHFIAIRQRVRSPDARPGKAPNRFDIIS